MTFSEQLDQDTLQAVLKMQPQLGQLDESKCLTTWTNSFIKWFHEKNGKTLTHEMVNALCHTLIAQNIRIDRLIQERDDAIGLSDHDRPGGEE